MGSFQKIASAVAGALPIATDLDMQDSNRLKNVPQSNDSNDAVPQTEAQSLANSAESQAESYADTEIENHRVDEVHDTDQPPQSHGNGAHDSTFVTASTAPLGDADGDDVLENDGPYRGVVISDADGNALLTVEESADGATITIQAEDDVTVAGDVTLTGEVAEGATL